MKFLFHGVEGRQEQTVQNPCKKEGVDQFNTFWSVVDFSVLELLKYLHPVGWGGSQCQQYHLCAFYLFYSCDLETEN